MEKKKKQRLWRDTIIVVASLLVAWGIMESAVVDKFVLSSEGFYVLNSFVAGLFFTSVFTTAPAIVVIAKLGVIYPTAILVFVGAIGAMMGDMIIFSFIKGHVSEDVTYLFSKSKSKRWRHLFQYRFVRWSLALLGAIVIASPLPDELGLTLMGLSKISLGRFALISYVFNAVGIYIVISIAKAI